KLQAILDARTAIGNLGEIVLAQRLLVGETEWAMVRGDHLQMVFGEPVPQLRLMPLFAQRRSEYVLGALEPGAREFVDRQQQVLWAGLRERRQAAVAGLAHLV